MSYVHDISRTWWHITYDILDDTSNMSFRHEHMITDDISHMTYLMTHQTCHFVHVISSWYVICPRPAHNTKTTAHSKKATTTPKVIHATTKELQDSFFSVRSTPFLRQFPLTMLHARNPPNRGVQISLYTFKVTQNLNLNLYHEIPANLSLSIWWISGIGGFRGCKFFGGNCHCAWLFQHCVHAVRKESCRK